MASTRQRKIGMWVGGILGAVLALAVFGLIVGPPDDNDNEKPVAVSAPSATAPAPSTPAAAHPPPPAATTQPPATPPPSTTRPTPAGHTDAAAAPGTPCHGLLWPRPVPDGLVGQTLSDVGSDELGCYTIGSATAPDGHDVMDDPASEARLWIVAGVRPAPGTAVDHDTPVTLTVRRG